MTEITAAVTEQLWFGIKPCNVMLRMDAELHEMVTECAKDAQQSRNAWMLHALRRAAKNWVRSADYLAMGRERGKGSKRKKVVPEKPALDATKYQEQGFPHSIGAVEPRVTILSWYRQGGPARVSAGINGMRYPDYPPITEKELEIVLASIKDLIK